MTCFPFCFCEPSVVQKIAPRERNNCLLSRATRQNLCVPYMRLSHCISACHQRQRLQCALLIFWTKISRRTCSPQLPGFLGNYVFPTPNLPLKQQGGEIYLYSVFFLFSSNEQITLAILQFGNCRRLKCVVWFLIFLFFAKGSIWRTSHLATTRYKVSLKYHSSDRDHDALAPALRTCVFLSCSSSRCRHDDRM